MAAGRTLEADAISQYLDGGLNVESIVKQVCICLSQRLEFLNIT